MPSIPHAGAIAVRAYPHFILPLPREAYGRRRRIMNLTNVPSIASRLAGILFGCAAIAISALFAGGPARAAQPIDGSNPACDDLRVNVDLWLGQPEVPFFGDASNEGWVWVQANRPAQPKFREVSGLVVLSRVATIDYPTTHDTHDQNTVIIVDAGQEDILSEGNEVNPSVGVPTFEIEWETGIFPGEKSGDGADPFYPREMWANAGDRFWAEGHWIFDCGHSTDGQYPAEIHPPRAAAAMRQTSYPLYATGATPVPVTMTDLYIHGRAGFVVDVLNCGMLDTVGGGNTCSTNTTPIDKNFSFYVCLPERPADQAVLTWLVLPGTRNTLSQELGVVEVPATSICENSGERPLDTETMLRVTAPLANSGAVPEDVYSRRLIAGWVFPPNPPLQHLQVELRSMHLRNDQDPPGFAGELSFSWLNLDADPESWRRLSSFDIPTDDDSNVICGPDHTNVMEDYEDSEGCGNGELRFNGLRYDFYIGNGESYTLRSLGWDQDCYDDFFGEYDNFVQAAVSCNYNPINLAERGTNDGISGVLANFGPGDVPTYGIGSVGLELQAAGNAYELRVDIAELDLTNEDSADVSVTMPCSFSGEVLLVGGTLTCNVRGANDLGPGLPRGTVLGVTADPSSAQISPADFTLTVPNNVGVNNNSETADCNAPAAGSLSCPVGTVPAGGTATLPAAIVPTVAGTLAMQATISTTSTDGNSANNSANYTTQAYRPVTVVIRPIEGSVKKVSSSGVLPVAILSVPGFDATRVAVGTVCFGDSGAPAERDCTEAHGKAHVEDVDRDRDRDVLLHFEAAATGIDPGDTTACLIGKLHDGSGIYGCGVLVR
jgi:hypothetical protein